MKKVLVAIKDVILYVWQIPQNLLGLILIAIYKKRIVNGKPNLLRKVTFKDKKVYIFEEFPGGISLGNYILIDFYRKSKLNDYDRDKLSHVIHHEYGHCVQSMILGILYLLLIGLPSGIHNQYRQWRKKHKKRYCNYYHLWCEASADKLGGIRRDDDGEVIEITL